jgi:hypothetical protein
VVLLLALVPAVLLLALAPVVLLVFPVSVVLLVCAVVTARCRVVFVVPKVALQPIAMAALDATAMAALATVPLHAMDTAMVRGETATGEAMASMPPAVTGLATPLPMTVAALPTSTAPTDAATGASWFVTESQ